MVGTNGEEMPHTDEEELDADLQELMDWMSRLRQAGVSELKAAQAIDVPRMSLNRVLRNKRWGERATVQSEWLKRRQYLLPLDAEGLLSLLDAMDAAQEGTTSDPTREADGDDSPEIATKPGPPSTSHSSDASPAVIDEQDDKVVAPEAITDADHSAIADEERPSVAPQPAHPESEPSTVRPNIRPIAPVTEEPTDTSQTQDDMPPASRADALDIAARRVEDDASDDEVDAQEQDGNITPGNDGTTEIEGWQSDESPDKPRLRQWLLDQIRDAEYIEEVASLAGASVLNWVPGLTLEQAKEAATERLGGWNPANPRRKPLPYLHGDAPLLLWSGREVSYKDEGARRVAFIPKLTWQDEMPYCAQEMRYGVPAPLRERRYAVDSHDEDDRGLLLGYRPCGWVPGKPYPDHDWFFGSEGNLRRDGTWWPSRAEALEYWYFLREMYQAYSGTEAERAESMWYAELEKAMTKTERFLLDEDYRMTFYYHGKRRIIPHHTRIAERRWMAKRIAEIVEEIARKGRRKRLRKFLSAPFRALAKPLIRSRANAASRKFFAAQLAKAAAEAQANRQAVTPSGEGQTSTPVLIEVQPEVCGQLNWKALDPPWHKRDRTRWYEPGAGPLSPEGAVVKDRMQTLDAS